MPCDSMRGYTHEGMSHKERREFEAMKNELDRVTRILCAFLKNHDGPLPPEAEKWFSEHSQWDKSQGR